MSPNFRVPKVAKFALVHHEFSIYAPVYVWQFDGDRQTDTYRHTNGHTTTAYTTLAAR